MLGIAYRPGIRDAGNSAGLAVAHALRELGVSPSVSDPMWTSEELAELSGVPTSIPVVDTFDAVFLATPHAQFADPRGMGVWRPGQFVLDAQGAWAGERAHFATCGVAYKRIGDAGWLG